MRNNSYIEQQITRIKKLIIGSGADLTIELKPRLVTINGETQWVVEPKRLKRMTTAQFITKHMSDLSHKIAPIGKDILIKHERNFISYTAKKVIDDESAKKWVRGFAAIKSDSYLSDGGFLRRDVSERLKKLCVDEGFSNINNIITMGIMGNENPAVIRSNIRENVFGLKPGERNKGLTAHSDMIMRTELSYAERNVNREVMRQDNEKIGVRLHYYGGPCSSGICPAIIGSGRNVKVNGNEITADFYYDDGIPWPPYHPRCHCMILRYLYRKDLENRGEPGGNIPGKFKEKIFIEDKKKAA